MSTASVTDLSADIYYQRAYSALYEQGCEHFEYTYQEGEHYVRFTALKHRISHVAGVEIQENLYDLETPYGYGGPLSNSDDPAFLQRAFTAYREHCQQQRIVCEFIRFHPFNPLAENNTLFDMHFAERQVVIVDLEQSSEERRQQYSKTTRNIVKKAANNLTVQYEHVPLSEFMSMYYDTMQKNTASDFFYFKEPYFEALMQIQGVSLLAIQKEHQYASIGFFMCSNELAHYHLSANNQELAKDNGNYLLLDAAFEHAKAQGCRYMMLGGGRTSSPEDSLFKFKSKFSPLNKAFYIAGLDFLPEKRHQLNQLWFEQNPQRQAPKLFQLYRA
ncbi:GNAT family N-acetyltransferase [Vibrio navarrensis]|uniref:GNAT family N-acetyltransferase n=1 Tax=Vibrio navarrensis TaxID=29495 RepID=UPI001302383C|nr:GNAT family N-acetyltransferase [Vibrio navarrensis]